MATGTDEDLDGRQMWLCRILEECKDDQDHLKWWQRDWDQIKIYGFIACCFALPHYIKGNRNVLAQILHFFCDADAGGVQIDLVSACESFCKNPRENEIFITEIIKAAPIMLKKSPMWFGDYMFLPILVPNTVAWNYFIKIFVTMSQEEQQVIVDYTAYLAEEVVLYGDEHQYGYMEIAYLECLRLSCLEKGDSNYFFEYLGNVQKSIGGVELRKERPMDTHKVMTIRDVEYAFRWCPPGTFTMGSPRNEWGRFDNETSHTVTLTKGFWMLETQVTQEMWESVMDSNPSYFKGDKRLPVEQVSWGDCQEFIQKLNDIQQAADISRRGTDIIRFSLPTEAQWEYACRAGTTTPFHFGYKLNGDKANCNGNDPYETPTKGQYLAKTIVVGSYPANARGLYDMHGNVWEWCSDWYGDYPNGAVTDPVGPFLGTYRVNRGGGWHDDARFCRSAERGRMGPSLWFSFLGFRLSLVCE